jgi:hypothetical protein
MKLSSSLQALVFALIPQLSGAEWVEPTDWPTSIYSLTKSGQVESLASRESKMYATLTTQPMWSTFVSVMATAFPTTYGSDFQLSVDGKMISESWFRALPTEVKSYYYNLAKEEEKFVTSGTAISKSAVPTTTSKPAVTESSPKAPTSTGTTPTAASMKNAGDVRAGDPTRSMKMAGTVLALAVVLLILV